MFVRALVVALAVLGAPAAFAQTPEVLAAVQRASDRGWEIYEHDQAAWHGTDAMLEEIPDPRAEGFSSWITERTPEGVQVLFLKPEEGRVIAAYRALYRDGQVRERGRIDQPLSETQMRINRARLLAIAPPLPQRCAQTYNSVTLPRSEPGPDGADVDVYLMPALASMNEAPFGGHFRLAVDTRAGVVRETQRFTNSCVTMQFENDTVGLMITQILGDTPTEVHVFLSLTLNKMVSVVSNSGLWNVEGRNIRYVSDRSGD